MTNQEEPRPEGWPSTVREAAAQVLANLSPTERENLAAASDSDLSMEHFGMGLWIRNSFGLWGANTPLLDDCAFSKHAEDRLHPNAEPEINEDFLFFYRMDADGASSTILRAARDLARS